MTNQSDFTKIKLIRIDQQQRGAKNTILETTIKQEAPSFWSFYEGLALPREPSDFERLWHLKIALRK